MFSKPIFGLPQLTIGRGGPVVGLALPAQDGYPVVAGEVPAKAGREPVSPGKIGDRGRLTGTDLDEGHPARGQYPAEIRYNRVNRIEAVGAAVECHMGIIPAHVNR